LVVALFVCFVGFAAFRRSLRNAAAARALVRLATLVCLFACSFVCLFTGVRACVRARSAVGAAQRASA
jgi:hypothetical protein